MDLFGAAVPGPAEPGSESRAAPPTRSLAAGMTAPILATASVAPPGWTAPAPAPAAPGLEAAARPGLPAPDGRPAYLSPTAGPTAADAAIRWRLRAATVDNLLVYVLYAACCALLHWSVLSFSHWPLVLVLSVLYHLAFESRGGQTPGKRRYGIKVVDLDGGPAGPKAIALRSVLRTIDQLPVWYLSGLVSMVRTGPGRRQRIGDVAGHTTVVAVDGHAAARGTPGWYLPTATLAAFALSVILAVSAVELRSAPLSSTQRAQFISGCQISAPAVDCTCLLTQLQAEGYTTLEKLRGLLTQVQAPVSVGEPSAARGDLLRAVRACRY